MTFDWATAAGTATAGVDYVTASGSRTIAAGATSATIAITVNGDVVDEADETFTLALSNPANATIADGSGLGTITDDDPAPSLSIGDISLAEGERRHHQRDVHRLPLGGEREDGDLRLGHRRGNGLRGRGLRERERQPHDRRRRHHRHDRDHRER